MSNNMPPEYNRDCFVREPWEDVGVDLITNNEDETWSEVLRENLEV